MGKGLLASILLAAAAGCSGRLAPPRTADYLEAYDRAARLEREGHPEKAARAYGEAVDRADRPRSRGQARFRQARELEKAGRRSEALELYLSIATDEPSSEMAPRSLYYAARMAHEDGDDETALSRLTRVVETYPEDGLAPQAVRRAVQWLGDRGEVDRALGWLVELEARLRQTDLGANLLYHQALIEAGRGRWEAALEIYERMAELHPYPGSTLYDDAMWRAGNLAAEHGQPERALGYLRALVSRREVSTGTGSYYTEWTDDAQLLVGRILLERLDRPAEAARAFEELATFPDSTLADDGLWWASRAYLEQAEADRSCDALRRLVTRFPYSNHLRRARQALAGQGC